MQDHAIWRYMNFTKFASMIADHSLWFARPFSFDDQWEGLHPPSTLNSALDYARLHGIPEGEFIEQFVKAQQLSRYGYFVNCWNIGESESDAMWRLYGLAPEGVAIKSTVSRVLNCVSGSPQGGEVVYYDPADAIAADAAPVLFKRKAFAWEQEYRFWVPDDNVQEEIFADKRVDATTVSRGVRLKINMGDLITSLVVAPRAQDWFIETVKDTCISHGMKWLADLVRRSYSDTPHESFLRLTRKSP